MIFGIVGLIGSGKTAVTEVFARLGAEIIDADKIGREVVESDPSVLYQLVMAFGETILKKDRSLDRRKLGQLAFANPEATNKLNEIVHPELLRRLDEKVNAARVAGRHAVVDAALLIFWNYQGKMDTTIVVTARAANRRKRLLGRGLSAGEVAARTKSQLSEAYLKKHADIILSNDGSLKSLISRAEKLYCELTEKG
ncbi:MAG: dephospho-CoA kinase [Candidatus Zixiibacteriota bacterium]